jgi:hypothetical protein
MSARDMMYPRNGARVTATALCRWERTPQGGLRATWRPGWRVTANPCAGGRSSDDIARLTRDRQDSGSRRTDNAQQRPFNQWLASGFIAALYLLVALAGAAIVVRG